MGQLQAEQQAASLRESAGRLVNVGVENAKQGPP